MSYLQSDNVSSKDMYKKANLRFVIYYPKLISIFDFQFCKFIFFSNIWISTSTSSSTE